MSRTATPLRRRLDEARLALAFMTRLPMGDLSDAPPLSRAVWAIPLAGVPVGLSSGLVLASLAALPAPAAGLIAVAVAVLLTGALHEDGLADLADGFGGGADRARKLEIMRDSRIGSYGVMALLLAVGLRATLLSGLVLVMPGAAVIMSVTALAVASRALLPAAMSRLPPARADGLGAAMARESGAGRAVMAALIGITALGLSTLSIGMWPVIAAGLAMVTAGWIVGRLALYQIGGITGDVLGAMQVMTELAALIALSLTLGAL